MCRNQFIPLLALTLALGVVPARFSQAQWRLDGAPVCTAAGDQTPAAIVSDGAGGAIITWTDPRNGNLDIYAQRLSAAGVPQWTADGVALCTDANTQALPTIVSDGAGGAIITWQDQRDGNQTDIYARRVNADGVPQWTADGVALCAHLCSQERPTIVSDGAGGAIVAWQDRRIGIGGCSDFDIYAQRVNADGVPQWTADGVALCTAAESQSLPTIVSDGAEGAIVTWQDQRNGLNNPPPDIYARRVNADGVPQWTADGVALCTAASSQESPTIVSDGAEGALVAWGDLRNGNLDVYARRVNADGVPQWTADGVALCTDASTQAWPTIVSDGAGGAIVAWQDGRSGSYFDIYARRMNAVGEPQWTADGVALCTDANHQALPTIVSDGAGGAIVAWGDVRSGQWDIYTQRVSAAGAPQWTADGVAVCVACEAAAAHAAMVSDGAGGAIITWQDLRNGTSWDIYAQRVYGSGGVAAVPPPGALEHLQLFAPSPNPTRDGQLMIRFNLSSSRRVSAHVFNLAGHRVRTLAADREFSPGTQALGWDRKNDAGVRVASGVYFVEVRVGTHSKALRAILLH